MFTNPDYTKYCYPQRNLWTVPMTEANTPTTPTSTDSILKERGSRYGTFTGHARITQSMERMFIQHMGLPRYESLQPDQQEALHMIFHKLGRIANGDPDYHDSWADIAGYAKLVADRLETGVEK